MVDRPVDVVRFAPDGTRLRKARDVSAGPGPHHHGCSSRRPCRPSRSRLLAIRLIAVQKGKDPAPLVNTNEETAAPVTACGSREIAFMIGPAPHETIAFAEPASGRMVRSIAPGKGPVDSISCSPDGKTVYFAARGIVWSTPSDRTFGRK